MNRLVAATVDLETKRRELGALMDIPREERAEDFDGKLEAAKTAITTAQVTHQTAALAEPEHQETREETTGVEAADREMRQLEKRASVGDVFDSIISGHQIAGAMAELQVERGMKSNEFSVRQLMGLETRATVVVPANVQGNQQPIIPYMFPQSVGSFLGINMPVVPVGTAIFPVLTTALSVEALAEAAAGTETDASFSGDMLLPSALQASVRYSLEDRARFAGLESSLRQFLSDGLADGFDKQLIVGAGGLLGTGGLTLRSGDAAAIADLSAYKGLVFDSATLDGRFASMAGDVRLVFGSDGYAHAGNIYRGNQGDVSALDTLIRTTAGVRISAHVPAAGNDNDQDVIVRKGSGPDMVAPIWENISVSDEYTQASKREIILTAVMLQNRKILRSDGFERRAVQVA